MNESIFAEEFLLVVKRTDFMPAEDNLKGPTVAEVLAATKHIPLSRTNQAMTNSNVAMLQTDVIQLFPNFECLYISNLIVDFVTAAARSA